MKHLFVASLILLVTLAHVAGASAQDQGPAHEQFVFAYRLLQRGEHELSKKAFDDYLLRYPEGELVGDAHYFRALLAREDGDLPLAVKQLDQAERPRMVPAHVVALFHAQVLLETNQPKAALKYLEAVDLEPLSPTMRTSVLMMRAVCYQKTDNLPAATAALEQATRLQSPRRASALLDLARLLQLQKEPAKALKALDTCLAEEQSEVTPQAAVLAGELAYQQKNYAKARDYCQIVLTRHQSSPQFADAVVGLAWADFAAERFGQVIETFDNYKDSLQGTSRVALWYLAGSSAQQLGEHERAVKLLDAIVTAARGTSFADKVLYRLAVSLAQLGRYDQVQATVQQLVGTYPDSPLLSDAGFLLATALAKQGNVAAAAAKLTDIIQQGPTQPYHAKALLQRARLFDQQSDLEPAVRDYQAYLKVADAQSSTARETVIRLAELLYRQDQFAAAIEQLDALLKQSALEPQTQQRAMYRKALAQIKLQQLDAAQATLTELLKKYPQNVHLAEARFDLGVVLMRLGKYDPAVASLSQAVALESLPQASRIAALRLMAIRYRETDQAPQAAATLGQLVELQGREGLLPDEQLWLGRYWLDQGQPDRTIKLLQPMVEQVKSTPSRGGAEAMYLTALALQRKEQTDDALAMFNQVSALDLGYQLEARLAAAKIYMQLEQYPQALGEFRGLLDVSNSKVAAEAKYQTAAIHQHLAQSSLAAGDAAGARQSLEEARAQLKKLVLVHSFDELSPLPQRAYLELAQVSFDLDMPDRASQELTEMIQRFPKGPYAAFAKAMRAALEGKPQEGLAILKTLDVSQLDAYLTARVRQAGDEWGAVR